MQLQPTTSRETLKTLLETVIEIRNHRVNIVDHDLLNESVIDQLIINSLFAEQSIKQTSQKAIWQISQYMGTPYTTHEKLMACSVRDGIDSMTLPIVDVTWIPLEILETIIEACNEMEVGPILFKIDQSHPDVTGFISAVLGMAVKKGIQSPVQFYDGVQELPFKSELLDWKKLLYFNQLDLNTQHLETVMGSLLKQDFDNLDTEDWKELLTRPEENWEDIKSDVYDAYCDLFEDFDVNETFILVKRYLIPANNSSSITDLKLPV